MNKQFISKVKNLKHFLLSQINKIEKDTIQRNRKINLKHIIYTCFNKFINHSSYSDAVGNLNIDILDLDKNITTQGFVQRKNNINPDKFLELNNNILNEIYKKKTKKYLIVDGSHLHFNKCLEKEGFKSGSNRNTYTKAIISGLKDYDNNIPINYQLNKNMNEREAFIKQLNYVDVNNILLFDRGYPSNILIKKLENKNIKYIIREKKTTLHVRHLIKNNLDEYYFNKNNSKCKVVKYTLNNTSNNKKPMEYYILTNILDMSIEDLKINYAKRWNIETHFKELKYTTSLGNITAKTENSVLQEIYINNLIYILNSYFKSLFIDYLLIKCNDKYKLNEKFCIKTFSCKILSILLFKDISFNRKNSDLLNIYKSIIVISNNIYMFSDEYRFTERIFKGPINKWKYSKKKIKIKDEDNSENKKVLDEVSII